jgi:hypothetical protein
VCACVCACAFSSIEAPHIDWLLLSVVLHNCVAHTGMKDFFEQNCIIFKGVTKGDEQRLEFMPL